MNYQVDKMSVNTNSGRKPTYHQG